MPVVRTTPKGLNNVLRSLNGLARVPNSEIHRIAAAVVLSSTQQRFQAGAGPDGIPWPKSRRAEEQSGQTLLDKGYAGGLVGSLQAKSDAKSGKVGTNKAYAAMQQFGGVVKPRNAKALAIPLTPQARRAGSPTKFSKKLSLVWPKGSKYGWLIERQAATKRKTAREIAQYLLAPSVTLPARPYLGITAADVAEIRNQVRATLEASMKG